MAEEGSGFRPRPKSDWDAAVVPATRVPRLERDRTGAPPSTQPSDSERLQHLEDLVAHLTDIVEAQAATAAVAAATAPAENDGVRDRLATVEAALGRLAESVDLLTLAASRQARLSRALEELLTGLGGGSTPGSQPQSNTQRSAAPSATAGRSFASIDWDATSTTADSALAD